MRKHVAILLMLVSLCTTEMALADAVNSGFDAVQGMLPQRIALVGPMGQMVTLSRQGTSFVVQRCSLATKKRAETNVCDGARVLLIGADAFMWLVQYKLTNLTESNSNLSPAQLIQVKNYLMRNDALDSLAKKLKEIDSALGAIQESKQDFPRDYNVSKELQLVGALEKVKSDMPREYAIAKDKNEISGMIHSLVGAINDKNLKVTWTESNDGASLAFILLKGISEMSSCSEGFRAKLASEVGSVCLTHVGYGIKRVRDSQTGELGWKELASGLFWWPQDSRTMTWDQAVSHCQSRKRSLPSRNDVEAADSRGTLRTLTQALEVPASAFSWTSTSWDGPSESYVVRTPQESVAVHPKTESQKAGALCVSRDAAN